MQGSGADAAITYAQRKRQFEDTDARCRQAGILLKPVVITAQGGIDPNAAKVLEVLHRAVAVETGKQLRTVRAEFRARSSIALIRANARASRRRDPDGHEAATRGTSNSLLRTRCAAEAALTLQAPAAAADGLGVEADFANLFLGEADATMMG